MAQFELHYMRNMVSGMLSYSKLAYRQRLHIRHVAAVFQQAFVHYRAAMARAAVDDEFRKRASAELGVPELSAAQDAVVDKPADHNRL